MGKASLELQLDKTKSPLVRKIKFTLSSKNQE